MARTFFRALSSSRVLSLQSRMASPILPEPWTPPVNRSMQDLDRSFFKRTIPISALTVFEPRHISLVRSTLMKTQENLGVLFKLPAVVPDDTIPNAKCVLLSDRVQESDPTTWSTPLTDLVRSGIGKIRRYDMQLSYEDWTMYQILEAILPELPDDEKDIPTGFAQVGHVAHLNLRSSYLPYKYLIGQVLLDKNPQIKTVINKTLDVGTGSVFRTFPYEVLAGPDDLNVELRHLDCTFQFDFGKVYWNTRLSTEHERLVNKFKSGEAVCDVMAGVGPFAVPAGKRKIFVRANDLNPESYAALGAAIRKNKVSDFVSAACVDGRYFIISETKILLNTRRTCQSLPPKKLKDARQEGRTFRSVSPGTQKPTPIKEPPTFDHYVMNLPATAVEFLDAFKGLYAGQEDMFMPNTDRKLPMIHVYTFQTRYDTEAEEAEQVCKKVSGYLGTEIKLEDADVEIHDVRLVAPKKKMYCASFRLPASVAFDPCGSPEKELAKLLERHNVRDDSNSFDY